MQKEYVVEFFHKGEVKEVNFTAANLLDLYEQIDEWKGSGEFAPVYSDDISGIFVTGTVTGLR